MIQRQKTSMGGNYKEKLEGCQHTLKYSWEDKTLVIYLPSNFKVYENPSK